MAGIGTAMKKRRFPDEDEREEAIDAEVEEPEREREEDAPEPEESADTEEEGGERPPVRGEDTAGGDGQAVYNRFVKNGMRLIYSEQMLPIIIKSLDGGGENPLGGLVNTTVMVTKRLEQSAAKAGQAMPDDVVEQGSVELMLQLAELSEKSGGHKYAPKELVAAKTLLTQMKGQMAQGGPPQGGQPQGGPPGPQPQQPGAPRGLGAAMGPRAA